MKALISPDEGNRIVEVLSYEFPVAEPLFWVTCGDNVTTEWSYTNGAFVAPVIVTESTSNSDPVSKLKSFLSENPDVAELLGD